MARSELVGVTALPAPHHHRLLIQLAARPVVPAGRSGSPAARWKAHPLGALSPDDEAVRPAAVVAGLAQAPPLWGGEDHISAALSATGSSDQFSERGVLEAPPAFDRPRDYGEYFRS